MSDRMTRREVLPLLRCVPERRVKTPVTIAPEALDFTRLIRSGETVGWAEATAEPVFLTRLLDAQAERWMICDSLSPKILCRRGAQP